MADSINTATPAESPAVLTEAATRPNENRSTTPSSEGFQSYISSGWADREETLPPAREQAPFAAARRDRLSALYLGQRLIIPAGEVGERRVGTEGVIAVVGALLQPTGRNDQALAQVEG